MCTAPLQCQLQLQTPYPPRSTLLLSNLMTVSGLRRQIIYFTARAQHWYQFLTALPIPTTPKINTL